MTMFNLSGSRLGSLATAAMMMGVAISPAQGQVQVREFNIPAQSLSSALLAFSRQSDVLIVVSPDLTNGKRSKALSAAMPVNYAIAELLRGTDLQAVPNPKGGYSVERIAAGRSQAADGPPTARFSARDEFAECLWSGIGNGSRRT
jgi:hypothetical protein